MKVVRIKQCKFEKRKREAKVYCFHKKGGCVIKLNRFFLNLIKFSMKCHKPKYFCMIFHLLKYCQNQNLRF